jgi:hypothetical protein
MVDRYDDRRSRDRADAADADLARLGPGEHPEGSARAGRVYDGGAIPTAVPAVFLARPVTVGGPEVEGGAPSLSEDGTSSFPFVAFGPKVPRAGDYVVARRFRGRWVAGQGGHHPPGKICGVTSDCGIFSPGQPFYAVPLPGATVTVSGPGGFSASGTTDRNGRWCVGLGGAGAYTVSGHKSGHYDDTKTLTVADTSLTYYAQLCLCKMAFYTTVWGCVGPLAGATWTLTQEGGFSASGTTGSDGVILARLPAQAPGTITVSAYRFKTRTYNFTPRGCQVVGPDFPGGSGPNVIGMASVMPDSVLAGPPYVYGVQDGYVCDCLPGDLCNTPISKSLVVTDSALGATCNLDWGTRLIGIAQVPVSGFWGDTTFDAPGCGAGYFTNCLPGGGTPLTYGFCTAEVTNYYLGGHVLFWGTASHNLLCCPQPPDGGPFSGQCNMLLPVGGMTLYDPYRWGNMHRDAPPWPAVKSCPPSFSCTFGVGGWQVYKDVRAAGYFIDGPGVNPYSRSDPDYGCFPVDTVLSFSER